ncbi:MAG TPA: hypothetical protein VFX02_09715 [Gammaproteobacteria bacterium]|nr:hypothetical protein [Gammaproteobacteria bacterium]
MGATLIYLIVSQLVTVLILRYVSKHWIFNPEKKARDAARLLDFAPDLLAQKYKEEIKSGEDLKRILIKENRKYLIQGRFESFVIVSAHLSFLGLVICGFLFTEHPWLFLSGSIVLFWFLVLGVQRELRKLTKTSAGVGA